MYAWKNGEIMPKIERYKILNSEGRTFYFQNIPFYVNYEAYNNETLEVLKNKKLYDLST